MHCAFGSMHTDVGAQGVAGKQIWRGALDCFTAISHSTCMHALLRVKRQVCSGIHTAAMHELRGKQMSH